jgi:hypothetical protein
VALVDEVVVETNWILDVALEQDSGSVELFEYGRRGEMRLFLPSFSVAESIKNIETKGKALTSAAGSVDTQRGLFALVDGCTETMDAALIAMAALGDRIEERFRLILEEVTKFATLIEPTPDTVRLTSEIRGLLKLSPADSTVLATVSALVRTGGCGSLMSRDKSAFSHPDTQKYMQANGITYYDSAHPIVGPRRPAR